MPLHRVGSSWVVWSRDWGLGVALSTRCKALRRVGWRRAVWSGLPAGRGGVRALQSIAAGRFQCRVKWPRLAAGRGAVCVARHCGGSARVERSGRDWRLGVMPFHVARHCGGSGSRAVLAGTGVRVWRRLTLQALRRGESKRAVVQDWCRRLGRGTAPRLALPGPIVDGHHRDACLVAGAACGRAGIFRTGPPGP